MISPVIPMGDPVRSSAAAGSETGNVHNVASARHLFIQTAIDEFFVLVVIMRLLERLDPLCLADDIAETYAELVVDHTQYPARHTRTDDPDIARLSGQTIAFHHRALRQLQQALEADAGTPYLH